MSRLERALRGIASELADRERSWALVGGLAVSARAEPRFTRDIDLAVAVRDDATAEALVHGLAGTGYRVLTSIEQEAAGRLATVRLETPGEGAGGVVVDLLFASSGVEAEIVRGADVLEVLPGLRVPAAGTCWRLSFSPTARSVRRISWTSWPSSVRPARPISKRRDRRPPSSRSEASLEAGTCTHPWSGTCGSGRNRGEGHRPSAGRRIHAFRAALRLRTAGVQ